MTSRSKRKRSRSLSATSRSAGVPPAESIEDIGEVDFAILTALEIERREVCAAFGLTDEHRVKRNGRIYWHGIFPLGDDAYYVVIVAQPSDMGQVEAALLSADVIRHWSPSAALLVGIAASAERDVVLGDVVVGRSVYYYEHGKVVPSGIKPQPEMMAADAVLLNAAIALPEWRAALPVGRPSGGDSTSRVHLGVIASGEKVIADAQVRDSIAAGHRKILAIEMEGYGFSRAVWNSFERVRHLSLRGICDDGSPSKDDNWHRYAAAAAADFAKHLLQDRPLPPKFSKTVGDSETSGRPGHSAGVSLLQPDPMPFSHQKREKRRYWVFDWFDAQGIRSDDDVKKAIRAKRVLSSLSEQAQTATVQNPTLSLELESVVAGRGIDLSGDLDCCHSVCMEQQVDRLLRHVWHYFDRIVVADVVTPQLRNYPKKQSEHSDVFLTARLQTLLYLQRIGAEGLLEFCEKPRPCALHWRDHANEAGLAPLTEHIESFIDTLAREASISFSKCPQGNEGHLHFTCNHSILEHTFWGEVDAAEARTEQDAIHAAAERVMAEYAAHLTSDCVTSHDLVAPLGSTVPLHHKMLQSGAHGIDAGQVAFHLDLPVLRGLPLEWLVKVRMDNRPSFDRYRHQLRQAIREAAKTKPNSDGRNLAMEIQRDLIDPELARIRDIFSSAERSFSRKAAAALGMGTLATVCGLMLTATPPVAAAAGVGTVLAGLATAVSKFIEERERVSLSGMYFLWQATQHQHAKI